MTDPSRRIRYSEHWGRHRRSSAIEEDLHISMRLALRMRSPFSRRYGKNAEIIAGGTDLLGKIKDEILPRYPEAIINIKSITGLDFIKEEGEGMRGVGALTRLEAIAER